jgi:hypothetical protein
VLQAARIGGALSELASAGVAAFFTLFGFIATAYMLACHSWWAAGALGAASLMCAVQAATDFRWWWITRRER